ncbi:MAG: ATP-dependent RNA helicase HrpA [Pseudomonadales bacterium]
MNKKLQSAQERCHFPVELPVSAFADDIVAALKSKQVIVVAGHTGSGKTTQLPKMCLLAGFGDKKQIAHTQPRRLAAMTVAQRLADELQSELGEDVGYQVRFDRQHAKNCLIKLQTDGILLNEIQRDPLLKRYDCIIVDEAHERSLNVDFLLAYLRRILPSRPDLRVVITSATIDTERFSRFFFNAPVFEISGQTFPVDIQYRSVQDEEDIYRSIADTAEELMELPREQSPNVKDILVFLSTENEIHEASRVFRGRLSSRCEVLPLYARLPARQQQKVFKRKSGGLPRIILATNIAETSVTVPGIRYVIDTGYARFSRYSFAHKIQQLPIEEVSRASAAQRSGRCGRLAPGICFRLYSEESFQERPEFTEPEILRTNLAAVILKLSMLGVRDVEGFEFLEQPDSRLLRDGERLLLELQAIESTPDTESAKNKVSESANYLINDVGQQLARLPLDPRLGRTLLAGQQFKCLREVVVIAAALSATDPRERPTAMQQQADKSHKRFEDPRSDFITLLKLWRYLAKIRKNLSTSAFNKRLRREFLSIQRTKDWFDVHAQLLGLAEEAGLRSNSKPASAELVHRALLSGFVTQIGVLDERREYVGTRRRRFRLFPGSALAAKPPAMIFATEIVETGAIYARNAAQVRPEWALKAAEHLLTRSLADAFFDVQSGTIKAYESASLQGLAISKGRQVLFTPHQPAEARRIFIEQALVAGLWHSELDFIQHNARSAAFAREIAAKLRRPDLLCVEEAMEERYLQLMPAWVNSCKALLRWHSQIDSNTQAALRLSTENMLNEVVDAERLQQQHPDVIEHGGNQFAVRYQFCPGEENDGVEILVPTALQSMLTEHIFDDLVPGMFEEKCTAILKTLPKSIRKRIVPIADTVKLHRQLLEQGSGGLFHRLESLLSQQFRIEPGSIEWDLSRVADCHFARISLIDESNTVVKQYRARYGIKKEVKAIADSPAAAKSTEVDDQPSLPLDVFQRPPFNRRIKNAAEYPDLPDVYEYTLGQLSYRAFPGLLQKGEHIELCLFHREADAKRHSRWAVAALFMRAVPELARQLRGQLFSNNQQSLALSVFPEQKQFVSNTLQRVFFEAFDVLGCIPASQNQFKQQLKQRSQQLQASYERWSKVLNSILLLHYRLVQASENVSSSHFKYALEDVKHQLNGLLCKTFLAEVSAENLRHYPRYLEAAAIRLERLREQQGRDRQQHDRVLQWQQRFDAEMDANGDMAPFLENEFYWLLQEYRVSLFAQQMGTAVPVSNTRLQAAWQQRYQVNSSQ